MSEEKHKLIQSDDLHWEIQPPMVLTKGDSISVGTEHMGTIEKFTILKVDRHNNIHIEDKIAKDVTYEFTKKELIDLVKENLTWGELWLVLKEMEYQDRM